MNYEIVNDFPNKLIFEKDGPFISLYQPTHRHLPEKKQDPIVFKNLIQQIESSLKQKYPKKEIVSSIMKPLYKIKDDKGLWSKSLDGLAVLANPNKCIVYKLHRPVKELAVAADSPHIKPLIRIFQSADKYQLLGLSRSEFAIYEGNRYGFKEIEMDPETPRTIKEVLGEQFTDSHLTHGSYGGTAIFHGHGGKKDEIDKDTIRFFRYVDKLVLENYSKHSKLPLILVSLAEHHTIFKEVSRNPYIMEEGIKESFDSLDISQLKEKAWKIIEPIYLEKTKDLVDSFQQAKANSLGSDDLAEAGRAAFENRVKTILIEADKFIPGKIQEDTGSLELGDIKNPDYNDVLDDIAELVFKNKGEVVVLPKERMPGESGVAAIFRY